QLASHWRPPLHVAPSHSSPHSAIPSPHTRSGRLQSGAQPSHASLFPSSQTSPSSRTPSPQNPLPCCRIEPMNRRLNFFPRSTPEIVMQFGSMRAFSRTRPRSPAQLDHTARTFVPFLPPRSLAVVCAQPLAIVALAASTVTESSVTKESVTRGAPTTT